MRRRELTWMLAGMIALICFPAHGRSLQQVRNSGTLRIGIALATPWAMHDREGEFMGFDVDVGRKLAADMAVEPEFVLYDWAKLIQALEIDEVDILVAGLTITPDRALHANFSAPYSSGGVTLATNLSSTANVKNLADLDDKRYTLAVVAGSVGQTLADRVLPRITVREFETAEAAGAALIAGEIDAYLEEEPVPTFLALENPTKVDVPLSDALLVTHSGFAVGKGDADFLAFLNAWIVAREDDTWLPTTQNYWFKSLQWRDRLGVVPDR